MPPRRAASTRTLKSARSRERCILGFNSGPPMVPSAYNNNVQIVQTRDRVLILNEMIHSARVVDLTRRQHHPACCVF